MSHQSEDDFLVVIDEITQRKRESENNNEESRSKHCESQGFSISEPLMLKKREYLVMKG